MMEYVPQLYCNLTIVVYSARYCSKTDWNMASLIAPH